VKLVKTGDGEYTMPIRQSDLNSFFLCPEQARLKFAGLLPRRTTEAMALGTAVHAGIEADLAHGAARTDAIDVIAWQLENLIDSPDFEMVKLDTDTYFEYAFKCFDAWFDHIRPVIGDVVAVERTFKLPFAEYRLANDWLVKVELHGTIDCVTSKALWDWKTANSSWKSSAWEKERWAVQPTIYTWAAQQLGLDTDPTTFSFGVMVKGKDPVDSKSAEIVTVRRDQRHWEWLRRQLEPLVHLVAADLPQWPLHDQGWHCSGTWCPVWSQCKGSHAEGEVHLIA